MRIIRILTIATVALCSAAEPHFATIYPYPGTPTGLVASDGAIYGAGFALDDSNSGCGEVFQLQPAARAGAQWSRVVLHAFTGWTNPSDGCGVVASPVPGPGAALYGVTYEGGSSGGGVVYGLYPPVALGDAWTEGILSSFSFPANPFGVLPVPDGNLYAGTTELAGHNAGGLYDLEPPATPGGPWTTTLPYSFPDDQRRSYPTYLTLGSDGAFYGAIAGGGLKDFCGAVFKLQPPTSPGGRWTDTILHVFRALGDGATPNSVMLGPDGVLYGTTFGDSQFCFGAGSVFSLTPPASPDGKWTKQVLRYFTSRRAGNYGPDSPLIMRNGKLYGASGRRDFSTNEPGGEVYELSPPGTPGGEWTTTILHHFEDGQVPSYGPIAMDRDGTIYGGTYLPNAVPAQGTIYRIELK